MGEIISSADIAADNQEAQAALQSMEQAMAPDVTADAGHQDTDWAEITAYAQSAFNEVLAQYRFMGLICGITGPNDDETDVQNARDALIEALSDFLEPEGGPLGQQVAQAFGEYNDLKTFRNKYDSFPEDEAQVITSELSRISMGHPADLGGHRAEIAGGSRTPDLSNYLERGILSLEGAEYILRGAEAYRRAAELEQIRRQLAVERRRAWWSGVWDTFVGWYQDKMALIREGKWLVAAAQVGVDVALIAAEEVVVAGLVAGLVAVTGGVAAFASVALAGAVRVALRVERLSARTVDGVRAVYDFRIALNKVEPHVLHVNPLRSPISLQVTRRVDYDKRINVETDLTADERRAVGEGGQGSTRPDTDPPEPGQQGRGEVEQVTPNTRPVRQIDCFDVPRGVDRVEFDRQLKEQQATINTMTADDMGYAHTVLDHAREQAARDGHRWRANGGRGKKPRATDYIRDTGAQTEARQKYQKDLKLLGHTKQEIAEIMSDLDATHFLDLIAGGDPLDVGMGGSRENQRIGPAWSFENTPTGVSRAEQLRHEAEVMRGEGLNAAKMNVELNSC